MGLSLVDYDVDTLARNIKDILLSTAQKLLGQQYINAYDKINHTHPGGIIIIIMSIYKVRFQ